MELRAELYQVISDVCDVPIERIHDDATVEELGFDSLASAEALTELEIRLDRELPVGALRRLVRARTVGDVAGLLETELREPSTPTAP
jgi:acyl carrier protein